MEKDEFEIKLNMIVEEFRGRIDALLQEDLDPIKMSIDSGDYQAWERDIDHAIEWCGRVYDILYQQDKRMRKKLRKVLGYTYP